MTMLNHTTAPVRSNWLTGLRSAAQERRRTRASRRALEAELASYRTPAEVEDLFATLRQHDDNATAEEMRRILFRNVEQRQGRTAA